MNTWKTANAVVRHLDAPFEGDVRITPTTELRVRDDVDGWAR